MVASRGLIRVSAPARHLLVLAKVLVSAGLLAVLLARADLAAIAAHVQRIRPMWMLTALAVYGVMIWISAWRWRLLLAAQSVSVPLTRLSESFLVATFFNNFLPSNIGGDVVRIADTAPLTTSKTIATTVVLVDRILGLVALVAVAGVGLLIGAGTGLVLPLGTGAGYGMILVGVLVLPIAVLVVPGLLPALCAPLGRLGSTWVDERLRRLSRTIGAIRACPGTLGRAFGGALLVQASLVIFYLCTARGLAIPLPWLLVAVVVPVSLIAQMLPISINGLGVREVVFVVLFGRAGVAADSALALSLVSAGLILVFSSSGGILLARRGIMPARLPTDTVG